MNGPIDIGKLNGSETQEGKMWGIYVADKQSKGTLTPSMLPSSAKCRFFGSQL
jgi:hypothetical protein